MASIPWVRAEGAQGLAQLRGWLWGRGVLGPMQPWLPWLAALVSPCGSAIPNRSRCFWASPITQNHPRLLSPMEKLHLLVAPLLPRAGDTSCLACISSTAISKLMARSCPGT